MDKKNNLIIYSAVIFVFINILINQINLFAQSESAGAEKLSVLVNDYKAKIKTLIDELSLLKARQAGIIQENNLYREEIKQLKETAKEKQTQINADAVNQSKEKLLTLEKEYKALLKEHQQKISYYEEQLGVVKQNLQAKEQESLFLNQLQNQFKEEKSELEKQNQSLNAVLAQNNQQKDNQLKQFQDELNQLKRAQQEKQAKLTTLEQANTQLIQAKLNFEKQINQAIPEKDRQIKHLQDELAELRQSERKNKTAAEDFAKQNAWLKDQSTKDRKIIEGLKQQQSALGKDKDALLNSLKEAGKNINELKRENSQNQDLNTLLSQTMPGKDRQIKQLQDELRELRQSEQKSKGEFQQLFKQNDLLKEQLRKQTQDLSELFNQAIPEKDRQIKHLQDELAELRQSERKNKTAAEDFAKQNTWLKDQYIKDRKIIEGLKQQQSALGKDKDALLNSLKEAGKNINELKGENELLLKQNQESSQQLKGYSANKDEPDMDKFRTEYKELAKENETLKAKLSKEDISGRLSNLIQQNKKLIKENSVLHYNLGVFYSQAQNYKKAALEFEKVLKLNPNDTEAQYNLGVIYGEHMEDPARAIAHFKKYLSLSPQDNDADVARKYIIAHEALEQN